VTKTTSWFVLALALGFSFGLIQLFSWRFETGDVYPQYSSLRADPLGTQALFESYQAIRSVSVSRNYQPLDRLKPGDTTVFYLGVGSDELLRADLRDFDKLTGAGARLVLGLLPVLDLPAATSERGAQFKPWGVKLMLAEPNPKRVSNLLYFIPPKDWSVVRETSGHATLIERRFGKGSLVLAADGYPMSNQALLFARDPKLLSWLAGASRRLTFDESHFGVTETGSVAALGRRYHLHAFLAALLLLAVLFIWKNSTPLVPELPVEHAAAPAAQSWGMPHYLLRRAAPPAELMGACLNEWRKSLPLGPRYSGEKLQRVEEIAHSEHDPVKAYQAIGRALAGEK
jgi:hypothetical protein